jgi:hypothetical protein
MQPMRCTDPNRSERTDSKYALIEDCPVLVCQCVCVCVCVCVCGGGAAWRTSACSCRCASVGAAAVAYQPTSSSEGMTCRTGAGTRMSARSGPTATHTGALCTHRCTRLSAHRQKLHTRHGGGARTLCLLGDEVGAVEAVSVGQGQLKRVAHFDRAARLLPQQRPHHCPSRAVVAVTSGAAEHTPTETRTPTWARTTLGRRLPGLCARARVVVRHVHDHQRVQQHGQAARVGRPRHHRRGHVDYSDRRTAAWWRCQCNTRRTDGWGRAGWCAHSQEKGRWEQPD